MCVIFCNLEQLILPLWTPSVIPALPNCPMLFHKIIRKIWYTNGNIIWKRAGKLELPAIIVSPYRNSGKLKILSRSHLTTILIWLWNISNSFLVSSAIQYSPTLCDPMDCSRSCLPIHHQQPELAQTHVHQVSDAVQPSHPLSSPSPPAFNLSQHQVLFQWVHSSHLVAKVWELQLQHQAFQWILRVDFL